MSVHTHVFLSWEEHARIRLGATKYTNHCGISLPHSEWLHPSLLPACYSPCALQWDFYAGKYSKPLDGHLRLCEKDWNSDWVAVVSNCTMGLFLGRHHQSREREFWKRVCFIHWLLRGCAGKWIEIGPPRQTAVSNSTSTTKHKLKKVVSFESFLVFLVNLSR